jgi:hypothetical protein
VVAGLPPGRHAVAAGVGEPAPRLVWVGQEALLTAGVAPWAGANPLPLWLLLPGYDGICELDVTGSGAAGLAIRPLADTARDTLEW